MKQRMVFIGVWLMGYMGGMACKNCHIEAGEMHDVNGCFKYEPVAE